MEIIKQRYLTAVLLAASLAVTVAAVGGYAAGGSADSTAAVRARASADAYPAGVGSHTPLKATDSSPKSDGGNPLLRQAVKADYNIGNAADFAGSVYLSKWFSANAVSTFVNEDGAVTVCVLDEDAKAAHIYEFSITLEPQRKWSVPYEFDMFGAFTKDSEGNYYFFFAKEARAWDNNIYASDADNEPESMAMVKYDRSGGKVKTYKRKPKVGSDDGVRLPFRAGCRLEVSGSMIAVHFARAMFFIENGTAHQASYNFVLNKDTFEEVSSSVSYSGHSFNQFIFPINNGFVFVDHADAIPARAFNFAGYADNKVVKLSAFRFAGKAGNNTTNAQMGGLAKTSGGYIFCGSYGGEIKDKRNLLILTFDDAMKAISNPLYLTTYTERDGRSVGHPKIADIGSGQYLLLWELYEMPPSTAGSKYLTTKMQIIDEAGKPLSPVKDLQGLRLNMGDVLRYNRKNGRVYWAINDPNTAFSSLVVYALETKYAYANDDFILPEGPGAKGGGYGLSLRRFNPDKTAVSKNEEFTVDHTLNDLSSKSFPGALSGVALMDDGNNIAEILGTMNMAPVADLNRSNKKIKCKVPSAAAPGEYKLRIVVKTEGKDEWRVVTSADGNIKTFVDFTVR